MTVSTGKFKQMRGFDRGASADLFRRKQAGIARSQAMSMMDDGVPPPDDEMAEGPQPPQEEVGEPTKQSQQEANYREGNPQRSCGLCGHFDSKGHSCDVVDGEISPFGFSDSYLRQDNPFREGEKESFRGGTKVAVIAPVAAPPGLLTIGRQGYSGAV